MKKRNKIILYTTTFFLLTSGTILKLNKEKSNEVENQIEEYLSQFTEDNFLISAHRGFSSLEVENTEKAISLASEKDYIDCIEIDARMTKDGKIIISHNDFLLDSTDRSFYISANDYETIENTTFTYQIYPSVNNNINASERKLIRKRKIFLMNKTYSLSGLIQAINASNNKLLILDLKFKNMKMNL